MLKYFILQHEKESIIGENTYKYAGEFIIEHTIVLAPPQPWKYIFLQCYALWIIAEYNYYCLNVSIHCRVYNYNTPTHQSIGKLQRKNIWKLYNDCREYSEE